MAAVMPTGGYGQYGGSYSGYPQGPAGPTIVGYEPARSHAGPGDPQPACCGMCEPAKIVEQQWTFVGDGRGSHQFVPNYIYVGQGEGAWVREEKYVPNPRRSMALWCAGGCLCLLATLALTLLAVSLITGRPLGLPEGTFDHIRHHTSRAFEHVRHHASNAASALSEHAKNAAHHVQGAAQAASPHVHNALRGAYHHASNAAHSAHDAAVKYAPGVRDKLSEGAQAAYRHASGAASAAHEAVREHGPGVYEQAKQGAAAAANRVSQAAQSAASGVHADAARP